MTPSLQSLENQYDMVRSALPVLIAAGGTKDQQDQLRGSIVQSRTNYWGSIKRIFHEDDPQVATLLTEMNTEEALLKHAIQQVGQVAGILAAVTKAVDIGSKLAAKAISL